MNITGKSLQTVRETLQLTRLQMAALLGIAVRRTYDRYENGQQIVPLTVQRLVVTLLKSPQVLNADIAEIKRTV